MRKNHPIPAAVTIPLTKNTVFVAMAITKIRNADGIKHMIIKPGNPTGTRYGLFNNGIFLLSQTKDANSNNIPKLYKKFADEIMTVNFIYEIARAIRVETKIPTNGVLNFFERIEQNLGRNPISDMPRTW